MLPSPPGLAAQVDFLPIADLPAEVFFPRARLDRPGVAASAVGTEDERRTIQIEQVGGGGTLGREFHQDLTMWSDRHLGSLGCDGHGERLRQ